MLPTLPATHRIRAGDLSVGESIREPYNREPRTVEEVWRDPGIDALVCVRVPGQVLYLYPARRVKA